MKLITAYIQSFMLEKVTDALREKHIHGVTVLNCQGFGRLREGNESPTYLDKDAQLGFGKKNKIEIVCLDSAVPEIVKIIQTAAHTGRHGDGKIFISEICGEIDIRTGKSGEGII